MKKPALLGWSGGKDSALALYELARSGEIQVSGLLTTVTEGYERISMHGVRRELLLEQAKAVGYPLEEVRIPQQCTNEIYEERMQVVMERHRKNGIELVAFGDLFLESVRSYREERLGRVGMQGVFPLWGKDTSELAQLFVAEGFKAIVVCVDTEALSAEFSGREYDESFLEDLPKTVDPCGENGEFHSFVYAGPIFSSPVYVRRGEKVLREEHFYYCDLVKDADQQKD